VKRSALIPSRLRQSDGRAGRNPISIQANAFRGGVLLQSRSNIADYVDLGDRSSSAVGVS